MKKFTQILILSIFTILMIGGFAKSAFAVVPPIPLSVTFSSNPLFSEANFAPGNEVIRTVGVANNSGSSQNIIVEAINGVDTGGLGEKLNLVITEDGIQTPRYTGTLGAFLSNAGEVLLSPLSNAANTTYSFGITFDSSADDNLQNKTLGFDLCVGFQGGTTQCGNTVISGENGGNTGGSTISGSNGGTITLVISNEQALNITNVGASGSATITWDTNKLATSQVIYGVAPGPYNLNINTLPNLGYPLGSTEDGNKVMNHSVALTGLTPGATYVYRVVSHASPATVSYEHQFTVPLLAENNNPILNNNNNNLNNAGQVLGAQNNPPTLGTNNNGGLDTTENAGNLNSNGDNLLGASAGNIMGLPNLSFWALLVALLLLIILIIKIVYRRRKNKNIIL